MSEGQIRGLLLEEAVLHLLRSSGYIPIYGKGSDDTLEQEGNTIFVKGRGERHQIDAIADYRVQAPFSNPQRLLLEAKFYDGRQVGLTVIRNAVGVLNDVSQFFIAPPGHTARKLRYHYQYGVVSATEFSEPAQRYAYAHDVFLIPLGASAFFHNLLRAIRLAAAELERLPGNRQGNKFSGRLRRVVRDSLRHGEVDESEREDNFVAIRQFVLACSELGFGLIAVSMSGFPLFLVPISELPLSDLQDRIQVRIRWDDEGWYLEDRHERRLFSFDVPLELLALYAERGELTPQRALDMKQQELNEMRAVVVDGDSLRVIRFLLDVPWLEAIRGRQQRHV